MTPRKMLWGLIFGSACLRLLWASNLGPGTDEAYHYLFTVHRDWSYFDHPPMLAVVESAGLTLTGGAVSSLALRIGFIGLFAGSTLLMARLTSRFFGPWAGFYAALGLNLTAYYSAAASSFALPDGPLLFFWLLTLERLAAAFEAPEKLLPWVGVGLAWGCALLSKYHAVFLPMGAVVFILLEPSARKFLLKPGPYLAVGIGLLVFSPVIVWNATHGWASFAFQGARAVGNVGFRFDTLAAAIGGQAAYLFPWIWLVLVSLLVKVGRTFPRGASVTERFLICQSVVPLVAFTAVACVRPVLPHWTLVGYLSIFPLLGRFWEARFLADPVRTRRKLIIAGVVPIAIAGFLVFEYRTGILQRAGLPAKADPTADMYGWDQVSAELGRRGFLNDPNVFLFSRSWFTSGQIAFATRESGVPVLCYNHKDARSFAFWSKPDQWVGKDGILVSVSDISYEPGCYERFFEKIEPIAEFEIRRSGGSIRQVKLYRCVHQRVAFPFLPGDPGASRARIAEGFMGDDLPVLR
jgi:hypothetical protein